VPDPVAFISSTERDLKAHREQASQAARAMGFSTRMMEYFPAEGHQPSLQSCLDLVAEAEVVIVLVAHLYGSKPPGETLSYTQLECEHAWKTGKEVLAFLVEPEYAGWPLDLKENYRLVTERHKPGIHDEVDDNERKLAEFKRKLGAKVCGHFTEAASVRALVSEALHGWTKRNPTVRVVAAGDPGEYLRLLEEECRQIRLQGFKTGRSEPYVFHIDEIYIPLTTVGGEASHGEKRITLETAIRGPRTVLIGEPGAGKSTFLRRIAFELCRTLRGTRPDNAAPFLDAQDRRFPILIRVADLVKTLGETSTLADDSPDWLLYHLQRRSGEYRWCVNEAFFRRKLEEGDCLAMIDGLDEAPDRRLRARVSRLFERATQAFSKCDFLVTTRPDSYTGDHVLKNFASLKIAPLDADEIGRSFARFAAALALSPADSDEFQRDLRDAIDRRYEVRQMAGNPVMLTALAVLRHNGRKLPEFRVELYESILDWLAAARPDGWGLLPLRKLALHMQDAPGGRAVQINKRTAAEFLAGRGGEIEALENALERETQDGGIISSVGRDLKFWHLSFQEYLAARELASFADERQMKTVVDSGKLYRPEWRETMRLYAGTLLKQGPEKAEGLFQAVLDKLGPAPTLIEQARCAALLGTLMRDLGPMGFKPQTPDYDRTLKSVMSIFEVEGAKAVDFKTRLEAADALGQVGDPRLDDDNWVTIPGGTFWMGAQNNDPGARNYDPVAHDEEGPVRQVTVAPFRLRRYPVTVAEYERFVDAGGYGNREYWAAGGFGKFQPPEKWEDQRRYPNRPVVGVSWYEAAAYCAWFGARLPTEAEWERAARGPVRGSKAWRYPWGDDSPDATRANYDNGPGHPTPVGLYPEGRSAEGVHDLAGNVWEWTNDRYDEGTKVLRGGSWFYVPEYLRVSVRGRNEPSFRNVVIGFRCAGESIP
jgi:formylglycine-generating enzyme required for sulfatase activity